MATLVLFRAPAVHEDEVGNYVMLTRLAVCLVVPSFVKKLVNLVDCYPVKGLRLIAGNIRFHEHRLSFIIRVQVLVNLELVLRAPVKDISLALEGNVIIIFFVLCLLSDFKGNF